jgi:hypothetical protein
LYRVKLGGFGGAPKIANLVFKYNKVYGAQRVREREIHNIERERERESSMIDGVMSHPVEHQ